MPAITSESHPMDRPLVRIRGVNYYFGQGETRTQVLFENNLEVMPGELVIMTGPSGSGKTTLLTLLGGLRTLQEGQIDIWDSRRNDYRALGGMAEPDLVAIRKSIGFIFQRHNLFDALSAIQNVRMAQQLKSLAPDADERATELLGKLGLGERVHYRPQQLSGGQRQRVAVARALINHPQLVLADEPTAALDERSGETVIDLLSELAKREGSTSLIVTHDSRIMNRADRIVDMRRGRIESNIVVAERLFLYEGLRKCAVFAALFPQDQYRIADKISIGLHPDLPVLPHHRTKCPWIEFHPAGSVIVRQGDVGEKFYFIRSGKVEVLFELPNRAPRRLAEMGKGEYFGDRALITNEPRNATVRAVEDTVVYTIARPVVEDARSESIPFINRILEVYGRSGVIETPQ